jgi:hypothetical protein
MSRFLILFLSLFSILTTLSQDFPHKKYRVEVEDLSNEWKAIALNNHVKIEAKILNDDDVENGIFAQYLIYRFTNLTKQQVSLSWNYKLDYLFNKKKKLSFFNLFLDPEQELVSNLNNSRSEESQIFYFIKFKNIDTDELVGVDLSGLKTYLLESK